MGKAFNSGSKIVKQMQDRAKQEIVKYEGKNTQYDLQQGFRAGGLYNARQLYGNTQFYTIGIGGNPIVG